jgi:hypothetical protein
MRYGPPAGTHAPAQAIGKPYRPAVKFAIPRVVRTAAMRGQRRNSRIARSTTSISAGELRMQGASRT